MRLRYLRGKEITVNWRGLNKATQFAPDADVEEELGRRLLANKELDGWFEVVVPAFVCDVCQRKLKTLAAIKSHKRTHKEQQ